MKFSKLHGLGNDFVLISAEEAFVMTDAQLSEMAREVCDRRRGVGADGLVIIAPDNNADAYMRIINSDGSFAEQCGNALRCVARYLSLQFPCRDRFTILTANGLHDAVLIDDNVQINMCKPAYDELRTLEVAGVSFQYFAVSMGNPHIIIETDDLGDLEINKWGPLLSTHPNFPNQTNVEFVTFFSRNNAKTRVWERGVGETEACGSGACAILVAGFLLGKLDRQAKVCLPGGCLDLTWSQEDGQVYMSGPAEFVFEGYL